MITSGIWFTIQSVKHKMPYSFSWKNLTSLDIKHCIWKKKIKITWTNKVLNFSCLCTFFFFPCMRRIYIWNHRWVVAFVVVPRRFAHCCYDTILECVSLSGHFPSWERRTQWRTGSICLSEHKLYANYYSMM